MKRALIEHSDTWLEQHPYRDRDIRRDILPTTPVAGGEMHNSDYSKEDADIVVSERSELERADQYSTVYIADGVEINADGMDTFSLDGTVVIGGRGQTATDEFGSEDGSYDGEHPGRITFDESGPGSSCYNGFFKASSDPGHIEGIEIQGPEWHPDREDGHPTGLMYYEDAPTNSPSERETIREQNFSRGITAYADGCTFRNINIAGFTHAAISAGAASIAPEITVSRCHLHDCLIVGFGYPINIYNGHVNSEQNYYNAFRHAITGFGHERCSYRMEGDIIGPDGLMFAIDMHNLNENNSGGMTAGKSVTVENVTHLMKRRRDLDTWYNEIVSPAMVMGGTPVEQYRCENMQVLHDKPSKPFTDGTPWSQGGCAPGEPLHDWEFKNNQYGFSNWTDDGGANVTLNGESSTDSDTNDSGKPEKRRKGPAVPYTRRGAFSEILARHDGITTTDDSSAD